MKKIKEEKETVNILIEEEGGFLSFMGKIITVYCINYIYTGKLIGVDDTCIQLSSAGIVYETGAFSDASWKNIEHFPHGDWCIQRSAIESFGVFKCK